MAEKKCSGHFIVVFIHDSVSGSSALYKCLTHFSSKPRQAALKACLYEQHNGSLLKN